MSKTFKERHWEKFSSSEGYTAVLKILISCLQRHKSVTWYFTITASLKPGTVKQTQAKCSGLPFEIPWVQQNPGAVTHYSAQYKVPRTLTLLTLMLSLPPQPYLSKYSNCRVPLLPNLTHLQKIWIFYWFSSFTSCVFLRQIKDDRFVLRLCYEDIPLSSQILKLWNSF